jgi:hypothetical protein
LHLRLEEVAVFLQSSSELSVGEIEEIEGKLHLYVNEKQLFHCGIKCIVPVEGTRNCKTTGIQDLHATKGS